MEHSDDILRKKIYESDISPIQWDRFSAWQKVEANLTPISVGRNLAVAACITLVILALSVYQESDNNPVSGFEPVSHLPESSPDAQVPESVACDPAETSRVNKKIEGGVTALASVPTHDKAKADTAENELAHFIPDQVIASVEIKNQIEPDIESPQLEEPVRKVKPLLGVIPTRDDDIRKSNAKLVWMPLENEKKSKSAPDKQLILARIK